MSSDWKNSIVKPNICLREALNVIEESGYQIAIVADDKGVLKGIVTDSDIRKGLLRGIALSDKISLVMNTEPTVVNEEFDIYNANALMKLNHFFHLPIVDEKGKVIGLHVADNLQRVEDRKECVVIMAGGEGKRLLPLTENIPKPMLPIQGMPMLEHIIMKLQREGFRDVRISINYLGNMIKEHFGDGRKFGVEIRYLEENSPLGTAGVLANLKDEKINYPILVTNGDVITDIKYHDMINYAVSKESDGLMAVRTEEWKNPFAVVKSNNNKLLGLVEKPIQRNQVNAGIYCVGQKLINLLNKGEYCDMPDLFVQGLSSDLELNIYPLHEYWLDVGRPEDYELANRKSALG